MNREIPQPPKSSTRAIPRYPMQQSFPKQHLKPLISSSDSSYLTRRSVSLLRKPSTILTSPPEHYRIPCLHQAQWRRLTSIFQMLMRISSNSNNPHSSSNNSNSSNRRPHSNSSMPLTWLNKTYSRACIHKGRLSPLSSYHSTMEISSTLEPIGDG